MVELLKEQDISPFQISVLTNSPHTDNMIYDGSKVGVIAINNSRRELELDDGYSLLHDASFSSTTTTRSNTDYQVEFELYCVVQYVYNIDPFIHVGYYIGAWLCLCWPFTGHI